MKLLAVILFSLWSGFSAQASMLPLPELLPSDLEMELALSAAPEHLRGDASVYILKRGGYEKVKQGTNGFTCIVRRSGVTPSIFHNIIAPMCFDAEGTRTLLPAILHQTRMLEAGKSSEVVLAEIEAGFASGRFKQPAGGINYMLSAANFLPDRRNPGYVFHYVPHWMFHAPGMKGSDIGQAPKPQIFGQEAFVAPPGKPWTFLIIPMGEKERGQVATKQESLVTRARKFVRFAHKDG